MLRASIPIVLGGERRRLRSWSLGGLARSWGPPEASSTFGRRVGAFFTQAEQPQKQVRRNFSPLGSLLSVTRPVSNRKASPLGTSSLYAVELMQFTGKKATTDTVG